MGLSNPFMREPTVGKSETTSGLPVIEEQCGTSMTVLVKHNPSMSRLSAFVAQWP
jgi:hypothetical protein